MFYLTKYIFTSLITNILITTTATILCHHAHDRFSSNHDNYNYSNYCPNYQWPIKNNYNFSPVLNFNNIIVFSIIVNFKEVEMSAKRVAAKHLNKNQHILNGNRRALKTKNHLKIFQLNTGNSKFDTFKDFIVKEIQEAEADIAILSESNMIRNDPVMTNELKNYKFENKFHQNGTKSRITVIINPNITYTRMTELEGEETTDIWLKVKTSPRKYVYILCWYRQWHILSELDPDENSGHIKNQLDCIERVLKPIEKLSDQGASLLVAGDLNIDQLEVNDPDSRADLKQLNQILIKYKNIASLQQLNHKPTWHRTGKRPSLLDLFLTNTPTKTNNIETKPSIVADHCSVKLQLHTKEIKDNIQFIKIREWKALTADNLMQKIKENERINKIFHYEDPEIVAKILIEEMNAIIEEIAPIRIVQRKGNEAERLNEEMKQYKRDTEDQLEKAIKDNNIEDWRVFRGMRNQLHRWLKILNLEKLKMRLNDPKNVWKNIKEYVNPDKSSIPTKIIEETETVTSPTKIAKIMQEHFDRKIDEIRKSFKEPKNDPMSYLQILMKKPESKFKLNEIKLEETYEIITKMKRSNSSGYDSVNSRILKEIPHIISIYMTHLINTMIRTSTFPKALKITKIIPLSKPKKSVTMKANYRPIAVMNTFEKIAEHWIKHNLTKYIEENNILMENHHGGRKKYSTLSAKVVIDEEANKVIDQNKFGLVLSTDLSSAYDCIDHPTLESKLQFYGIENKELELIKSFLKERHHFVEVQTKQSEIKESPACSVIQGSKLSTILYLIYTNEVPALQNLMKNNEWMRKNMKKEPKEFKDLEHTTVNFIDDSNSVISFGDANEAEEYVQTYFEVLKIYYNDMKLKLNPEKTTLMVISRPNQKRIKENIKIVEEDEEIRPDPQIKILGWYSNERLDQETNINMTINTINSMLNKLKPVEKVLTTKTRIMISRSLMISRLMYGMPLFLGETQKNRYKIHQTVMKLSRWSLKSYCFKTSVKEICQRVGWETPRQMLLKSSAMFILNIIQNRKPNQLIEAIRFPRTRPGAQMTTKHNPKTETYRRSTIYQLVQLYNQLPQHTKNCGQEDLKKIMKNLELVYVQYD